MNSHKRRFFICCGLTLLMCSSMSYNRVGAAKNNVVGNIPTVSVQASTVNNARLIVTKYKVENNAAQPGEAFTLSVTLKNLSTKNTASNIVLNYTNDQDTVISTYGNSNQIFINEIKPGQEKQVSFSLQLSKSCKIDTVPFVMNSSYADSSSTTNNDSVVLQIPVNLTSQLLVQSISIPDEVKQGVNTRIRITLKNTGGEVLNNISMNISGNGLEQQQNVILGRLSSGKLNYVEAYVNFKKDGAQDISVNFTYEDVNGKVYTKKAEPVQVSVVSNSSQQNMNDEKAIEANVAGDSSLKEIAGIPLWKIMIIILILGLTGTIIVMIYQYRKN